MSLLSQCCLFVPYPDQSIMHFPISAVLALITIVIFDAFSCNFLSLRKRQIYSPKHSLSEVVDVAVILSSQNLLVDMGLGSSDVWDLGVGYECINIADNSFPPQAIQIRPRQIT
jgi:hypothetical protein